MSTLREFRRHDGRKLERKETRRVEREREKDCREGCLRIILPIRTQSSLPRINRTGKRGLPFRNQEADSVGHDSTETRLELGRTLQELGSIGQRCSPDVQKCLHVQCGKIFLLFYIFFFYC